jgi:hypothetical protein
LNFRWKIKYKNGIFEKIQSFENHWKKFFFSLDIFSINFQTLNFFNIFDTWIGPAFFKIISERNFLHVRTSTKILEFSFASILVFH